MKIKFELNGHPIEIDENPRKKLSEFLRQENYFSVKAGCGNGNCTSCTVLINDVPMLSCLIPLAKVIDSKITTLDHFMKSDDYEDIEQAFKEQGINLCGYCNSGKIFTTYELIKNIPIIKKNEFRDKIIEHISFFTCNCVERDNLIIGIFLAAKKRAARLGAKKNAK